MKAAAVLLVIWNQELENAGVDFNTKYDTESEIKVAVNAIKKIINRK